MGENDPVAPTRSTVTLRWIVVVVLFILVTVLRLARILADDDGDDAPAARGSEPNAGVHVRTVSPGTCVAEAYPRGFVHPVPCTEPHPTEIVALLRYPAPPGSGFPPVLDLYRQSFALCEEAFKAYTGTTPDQTPAGYGAVLPLSYEWNQGERIVVCYAEGRNGVMLTSSLRKP